MENILNPIVLISLALLIGLHVLSVILHGVPARAVTYTNLALHVALLFVLSYLKLKIEEAVLVYLISVFAYTVAATVAYKRALKMTAEDKILEADDEEVTAV